MRREYDFTGGVRGKYAKRFRAGTVMVLLDPDVAKEFPDSGAVNATLRAVLQFKDRTVERPSRTIRPRAPRPRRAS